MMDTPWNMMNRDWIELGLFWAIVPFVILLAFLSLSKRERRPRPVQRYRRFIYSIPEARLLVLALPLELLWEIAQYPLYDVWHQNDWGYILYGLAHCTFGDLLILLSCYVITSVIDWNRFWFRDNVFLYGLIFTTLGVLYSIYSEIQNVRVKGTWGYTELMPLIPGIEIGGMPFLQWVLIPPVLLWLMIQFDYRSEDVPTPG